jgi:WD40 repeat protein
MDEAETLLFIGCHNGELLSLHFPAGQLLHRIGQHTSEITTVQFINRLKMIVTAGWGGVLTLWDNAPNGRRIDLLTEKKDDLLSLALSQESLLVATGTGKGFVNIWNLNDLRLMSILQPQRGETEVVALSFVEGSTLLVAADADGFITFWNVIGVPEPVAIAQLPNFYIDSTTSYILALCICEKFMVTGDNYGEVRLWDVSQLIQQYPLLPRMVQEVVEPVEFLGVLNQRGSQATTYTTTVRTYDATNCALPVGSFQLIVKWKAHLAAITTVSCFKANNISIVLTSSNDCCGAVWNMKTGRCLGFLQSNPQFGLNERKWTLEYDPKRAPFISLDTVFTIMDQADAIRTPPSSPH